MQNKSTIIILSAIIIIALGGALYWLGSGKKLISLSSKPTSTPRVIKENLTIPDTTSFTGAEGRVVEQGNVAVALVPKSEEEKVIVSGAALTVKGVYDRAMPEARKWAPDARLAFIKSLGAITLEGQSSQWQAAFSSTAKKDKGYEIIIRENKMISRKEIESALAGGAMPDNFADRDSAWAIAQLALIPQFQTASITAIVFSYNADAKGWDYIIPNSFGKSAIRVR